MTGGITVDECIQFVDVNRKMRVDRQLFYISSEVLMFLFAHVESSGKQWKFGKTSK